LRTKRPLARELAAVALVLALCGCSTIRHVFHVGDQPSKQAEQLKILQLRNQRFADEYVGSIIEPIRQFQASTDNAVDRLDSQNWLLSQATAAYTIASGPSPYINVVDMVVLTTLSRMVIDENWVGERFGERAAAVRDSYHRLEPVAVELAKSAIPPDQVDALQRVIIEWRKQNPQVTAIAYVHFRDVANSMGPSKGGGADSSFSGLFNMLGLDPFSSLDPAVREITQSRELAERTIYYAQRVPNLLDMQVERLTFEFATMPETKRLLSDANSVAGAASVAGRVIGDFPGLLTGEREAAIRQFIQAINVETGNLRQLAVDVRGTLEAGTATSNSLNAAIRAFDQMMAGFDKPAPAGAPAQPAGRPFDITEYTAAAAEITRAANELQHLMAGVGKDSPALVQAADRATARLQGLIDHAYWRILELIGLALLGGLAVALAYRGITRRWRV
jgi:hypothetical protein